MNSKTDPNSVNDTALDALAVDEVGLDDVVANVFLRQVVEDAGHDPNSSAVDAGSFVERFPDFVATLRREEEALCDATDYVSRTTFGFHDDESAASGLDMPDRIGDGRYVIERRLGRGGMGVVYLASDTTIRGRRVVVKTIRPGLESRPEILARLRREADVTGRLDDDAICPTHDVIDETRDWDEDGNLSRRVFVVMKYVPGVPLAEVLRRAKTLDGGREVRVIGAIASVGDDDVDVDGSSSSSGSEVPSSSTRRASSRTELLAFVERIARAVHVAHEAGVVHRDIKPANIMVRPDGQPVLLDFGLALDVDSDDPRESLEGVSIGTPSHMAPEQAEGRLDAIDRRTDVHALGILLYEIVTGHEPFRASNIAQALNLVVTRIPPSPRNVNPRLSRDLEAVVMKALEKKRANRFATAAEFADELERVRLGHPTVTRPPTVFGRIGRWIARHPMAAALIAVVVGVGIAATWKFVVESRGEDRQQSFGAGHSRLDSMSEAERRTFVAKYTDDQAAIELIAADPTSPDAIRAALDVMATLDRSTGDVLRQPLGVFGVRPTEFEFIASEETARHYRITLEADGDRIARFVVDVDAVTNVASRTDDSPHRVAWPDDIVLPNPATPDAVIAVRWTLVPFDTETKKPQRDARSYSTTFYYAPGLLDRARGSVQPSDEDDFDRLARAAVLASDDYGFGHAALRELDAIAPDVPAGIRDRVPLVRLRALVHAHRSEAARSLARELGRDD